MRFDVESVHGALEAIVADDRDRIDPRSLAQQRNCLVLHGEPACLAGAVLSRLGISRRLLRDLDKTQEQLRVCRHPVRGRFTAEAWSLLCYLQSCNDAGWNTWGKIAENAFARTDQFGRTPHKNSSFWTDRPWMSPGPVTP